MGAIVLAAKVVASIALFLLVVVVLMPRLLRPLRAWWYLRMATGAKPPKEVRRYLLRSGQRKLQNLDLPPKLQQEIAVSELAAALEEEGPADELTGDLLKDAIERLGKIPLEHCLRCKRPIFTHEAIKIGEAYYCKTCAP